MKLLRILREQLRVHILHLRSPHLVRPDLLQHRILPQVLRQLNLLIHLVRQRPILILGFHVETLLQLVDADDLLLRLLRQHPLLLADIGGIQAPAVLVLLRFDLAHYRVLRM